MADPYGLRKFSFEEQLEMVSPPSVGIAFSRPNVSGNVCDRLSSSSVKLTVSTIILRVFSV